MADEAARHADHRPRLGRGLAALIDLRLAGDFVWHELPLRCVIRYD